jgi:hypothetical protein
MSGNPKWVGSVLAALAVACGGSSVRHSPGGDGTGMGAMDAGTNVDDTGVGGTGVSGATAIGPAGTSGTDASGAAGSDAIRPGDLPGCGATPIDECEGVPNTLCYQQYCVTSQPLSFVDERGNGILCKYMSDSQGPDFACLRDEWCELDLFECRCGRHPGCQLGEKCAPCAGPGCENADYVCQRDIACTADNLDKCAAAPGQTCADGSRACVPSEVCPTSDAAGSTRCDGAPGGCCPAGNWCFDGRECRCGAHPTCTGDTDCVLSSIGLYACCAPGAPCPR